MQVGRADLESRKGCSGIWNAGTVQRALGSQLGWDFILVGQEDVGDESEGTRIHEIPAAGLDSTECREDIREGVSKVSRRIH